MNRLVLAVGLLVVLGVAPGVWDAERTSFRTTWELVARGREAIAVPGVIAVWEPSRRLEIGESSATLLLARLGGERFAEGTHTLVVCLLGALWFLSSVSLARSSGATDLRAGVAGVASAIFALRVGSGHPDILGASLLVLLGSLLLGAASRAKLVLVALALALVSRGGALVGLAVAALAATRGGSRLPFIVLLAWVVVRPEPRWLELGAAFATRLVETAVPLREALVAPFGASPSVAAAAASATLWLLAFDGGRRARWVLLVAIVGGAALFGTDLPGITTRTGLETSLSALGLVLPHFAGFHGVGLTAAITGTLVIALAFGGSGFRWRTAVAAGATAVLLVSGRPVEPPEVVAVPRIPPERGDVLRLPLRLGSDLAWQRAAPDDTRLWNGSQALLTRNPEVLAELLDLRSPDRALEWLERLGIERVWVAKRPPRGLGSVETTDHGWSLVRLAEPPRSDPIGRAACLDLRSAELSSSRGHPEVSVPALAVDGDARTRWGTGGPQVAGAFFEIVLGEVRELLSLELEMGRFRTDVPRGFRVLLSEGPDRWEEAVVRDPYLGEAAWDAASRLPVFAGSDPGEIRVWLGGARADRVRIELLRGGTRFDWSIAEICLRGRPPR